MGKPKAPTPADPRVVAAGQTATNVTTALANAQLGNVNQYTADGTRTFTTNGGQTFTDPTSGASYFIPQYEETVTLSAPQQAIKDQNDAASLNLSSLGNTLSGKLSDKLTDNFSLGDAGRTSALVDLQRQRVDPRLAREEEALRTRLANQGIKAGSEAYSREMATFGEGKNDAYTQMELSARGLLNQEAVAQDNQRINQIGALMSGGQVSSPTFQNVNMPSIPTVDYAGLEAQNFAQRSQNYQQENANRQSLYGGLFKLGGSAITAFSDKTMKEDIEKVGKLKGHTLYEYAYKDDPEHERHIGVMAQEVEKTRPDAVKKHSSGKRIVDYGALFSAKVA